MFVLTQDESALVNISQVNSIFLNKQGRVCITYANSTGCQLGEYEYIYGKTAIKTLANAIKTGAEIFYMPTNESLKVAAEQAASHGHREQHAANGAVIKRRGGS